MEGKKYCKHCGELIDEDCVVCPKCGKQVEKIETTSAGNPGNIIINNSSSASASAAAVAGGASAPAVSPKSWIATLLLCLFLGTIGIHRFYTGKIGTGIIMVLCSVTGFGLVLTGIWAVIDLITIILGRFKDKQGLPIKH